MSLSCRILFLTCATLFAMFVPLSGRIAPTTNSAGQQKTLLWLNLLPLVSRIQSDEIAASANGTSSALLSDDYSLNNGDSDDETTRPYSSGAYPVLLPLYPPTYVAPYAPIPLRQPYLSDATDEDTLIRAEFIKGVLEGLQGAGAVAADMKTTSDEMDSNKLLRSSSRKIDENPNVTKKLKRKKLPFVLLDDTKATGSETSQSSAAAERIYNIYEVHLV